jgi:hypothetical protein
MSSAGGVLPKPVPGLVIRYSYLWHADHLEGVEEGRKDRPCALIAAIKTGKAGKLRTIVLPITHSSPNEPELAIEIPPKVKAALNLDSERSWIICVEWNEFVWPGPDLRRLPNADDTTISYGFLPPKLLKQATSKLLDLMRERRARRVLRTE